MSKLGEYALAYDTDNCYLYILEKETKKISLKAEKISNIISISGTKIESFFILSDHRVFKVQNFLPDLMLKSKSDENFIGLYLRNTNLIILKQKNSDIYIRIEIIDIENTRKNMFPRNVRLEIDHGLFFGGFFGVFSNKSKQDLVKKYPKYVSKKEMILFMGRENGSIDCFNLSIYSLN